MISVEGDFVRTCCTGEGEFGIKRENIGVLAGFGLFLAGIAIIPLIIMFILFCVLFFNLFVKLESPLRDVLILLTAYICDAVSALCSVYVGKRIIDRYNIKRVI